MFINDTGKAILELCNGERTAGEIARELGERYQSEVLGDVIEYLAVGDASTRRMLKRRRWFDVVQENSKDA